VLVETDAGGDPDDEQSLVRFLLYANEWDIEGIIANRPARRGPENRNPERTGLGIVRRLIVPIWVNTFQPELEGKRWYHRFSALTSRAGGFDLMRDVLNDHGALGAKYPTNTE